MHSLELPLKLEFLNYFWVNVIRPHTQLCCGKGKNDSLERGYHNLEGSELIAMKSAEIHILTSLQFKHHLHLCFCWWHITIQLKKRITNGNWYNEKRLPGIQRCLWGFPVCIEWPLSVSCLIYPVWISVIQNYFLKHRHYCR